MKKLSHRVFKQESKQGSEEQALLPFVSCNNSMWQLRADVVVKSCLPATLISQDTKWWELGNGTASCLCQCDPASPLWALTQGYDQNKKEPSIKTHKNLPGRVNRRVQGPREEKVILLRATGRGQESDKEWHGHKWRQTGQIRVGSFMGKRWPMSLHPHWAHTRKKISLKNVWVRLFLRQNCTIVNGNNWSETWHPLLWHVFA